MVNEDKDLIFAAFQVVAPSFKSFNNSQQLLIVSLISSLGKDHLLREQGHWIPMANFGDMLKRMFVGHVTR